MTQVLHRGTRGSSRIIVVNPKQIIKTEKQKSNKPEGAGKLKVNTKGVSEFQNMQVYWELGSK